MQEDNIHNFIQQVISSNNIVLFMKGNRMFPQCGFSAQLVKILENLNVEFQDVNVLSNNDLREGIKSFTNWPTIPQLYVKGNFIGGCDIVSTMFKNGELQSLLEQNDLIKG